MTNFFVFMQLKSTSCSNKRSSLFLLKNYDVSMVQSTSCIIIIVPIPSLPKPPFLTAVINCKHNCRFSPLRNTGYPMRKLTIHFGNRPHKTPRETASHAAQYYTTAIQNVTFKANHIHRSVIYSLPHFYIPQNVNSHNKTPALKKF